MKIDTDIKVATVRRRQTLTLTPADLNRSREWSESQNIGTSTSNRLHTFKDQNHETNNNFLSKTTRSRTFGQTAATPTIVRTTPVWVFDTNREQATTNRVFADENRREWWLNHTQPRYRNPYSRPPEKMKTSSTAERSDN